MRGEIWKQISSILYAFSPKLGSFYIFRGCLRFMGKERTIFYLAFVYAWTISKFMHWKRFLENAPSRFTHNRSSMYSFVVFFVPRAISLVVYEMWEMA